MGLLDLGPELHLMLYHCMDDTVDAYSLSFTCKYFYSLLMNNQIAILRGIISSSRVYQYSTLAQRFFEADETLRRLRRERPLAERRQSVDTESDLFLGCLSDHALTKDFLTPERVRAIHHRYLVAAKLGNLYESHLPELSSMYEQLRTNTGQEREVFAQLESGIKISSLDPLVGNATFGSNRTFRARFCEAVELQSITIAALSVAASTVSPNFEVGDMIHDKVTAAWVKRLERLKDGLPPLLWQRKLECIEVYDFAYYFLLSKLIPPASIRSWWSDPVVGDFYIGMDAPNEPFLRQWIFALTTFRQRLSPYDIFELATKKAWQTAPICPLDKTAYVYEHGFMEFVNDYDWYTGFDRSDLSQSVACNRQDCTRSGDCKSWWNNTRATVGTPFEHSEAFEDRVIRH